MSTTLISCKAIFPEIQSDGLYPGCVVNVYRICLDTCGILWGKQYTDIHRSIHRGRL